MNLSKDTCEIIAFFGLIVVFEICERLWPARKVNRFVDLKLDVLSFAFALAVNRISTKLFFALIGHNTPQVMQSWASFISTVPSALKIATAIFIADFMIYWIHRAQHKYDTLWRTHAWHHSVEQMYWFAGFRTSFFHSFIYNIPQAFVPLVIFQLSPAEAGIGYSIALLIQFWEHTNFKVNIGPLKYLIITPEYHRIHHSATVNRGLNLGTTFVLWDKWFGTYVDPATVKEEYPLGLGEPIEKKKIPRMLLGV